MKIANSLKKEQRDQTNNIKELEMRINLISEINSEMVKLKNESNVDALRNAEVRDQFVK